MPFRVDKTGRRRYIGQPRRGRPGSIRTAVIDLGQAIDALMQARAHLGKAHGEQSPSQRAALLTEARADAELGVRFVQQALRDSLPKRRAVKPKAKQIPLPFRRR